MISCSERTHRGDHNPVSPLSPFLDSQGVLILDGGLATELEKLGHDLNHSLWSARVLIDCPEDVRRVHRSYLEAGADCIASISYQATVQGFVKAGLSEAEAEELLLRSVKLACEARDEFHQKRAQRLRPLVAASVGPYGAFLGDGSEYSGRDGLTRSELRSFHEPRWDILSCSSADLIAFETIPSLREAEALVELISEHPGVSAWLSFSCRDERHISDGTPMRECAAVLSDCDQIVAIGVNCTAPRHISSLIDELRAGAPEKSVVVYPNSGEVYDTKTKRWAGTADPVHFGLACIEWRSRGASMIGGCCRTGPTHISEMRRILVEPDGG